MRTTPPLPLPVKRALAKLGGDIRSVRLRRRIPTTLMAQRAFISRMTLAKVEKGDPAVSLGIYAVVLFILGMNTKLEEIADSRNDALGLQLEEERLPQRIRKSRTLTKAPRSGTAGVCPYSRSVINFALAQKISTYYRAVINPLKRSDQSAIITER